MDESIFVESKDDTLKTLRRAIQKGCPSELFARSGSGRHTKGKARTGTDSGDLEGGVLAAGPHSSEVEDEGSTVVPLPSIFSKT